MIISTPNLTSQAGNITPSMLRGLYLIWRSELQSGSQLNEIRELSAASAVGRATFGHGSGTVGDTAGRDRGIRADDLSRAAQWA